MGKGRNNEKLSNVEIRAEEGRKNFGAWVSYWRANPHRFATEHLQISLFIFQQILLWCFDRFDLSMFIASRGLGKSYLVAVYCVVRCILYPESKIVVTSGLKKQANLVITQKIQKELVMKYPRVAHEIADIKTGVNECEVIFKNGSTITTCSPTDNSRGYRATLLIVDEARMVKQDILKSVLKPFLNVQRMPAFFRKSEYKDYPKEENKEIYMSSAWYRSHWLYDLFVEYKDKMLKSRTDAFTCDIPVRCAIEHGLTSDKRIKAEAESESMSEIIYNMEYEGVFYGESDKAFFKFNEIAPIRKVKKALYPMTDLEYIDSKSRRKKSNKGSGEIRILGMDIAVMGANKSNNNDATAFTVMRLIPHKDSYTRQVCYLETLVGTHSELQAIRLKQLFYDFECDYIIMDCAGAGISVYDACCKVTYDDKRDEEYPAFCAYNNDDMKDRSLSKGALPVIYSMKANGQLNHEINMALRDAIITKKLELLTDETLAKDFLSDLVTNWGAISGEEQARLLAPYFHTTALVNEMISLEMEIKGGFIKLSEVGRNRKDRFSSLAYTNFLAQELEIKNRKKKTKVNHSNIANLW